MENSVKILALAVSLSLLQGCSQVKFYSDQGLTKETGLRFFTLKPYLLVEYKATKDNTVRTSVLYLPDIVNPQYMVLKPGIGSNEIKLALENSALKSYGHTSEPEFPDNIEAIAALLLFSSLGHPGRFYRILPTSFCSCVHSNGMISH